MWEWGLRIYNTPGVFNNFRVLGWFVYEWVSLSLSSNVVYNFWKYVWMKKYVKIRVMLFKHWVRLLKTPFNTQEYKTSWALHHHKQVNWKGKITKEINWDILHQIASPFSFLSALIQSLDKLIQLSFHMPWSFYQSWRCITWKLDPSTTLYVHGNYYLPIVDRSYRLWKIVFFK